MAGCGGRAVAERRSRPQSSRAPEVGSSKVDPPPNTAPNPAVSGDERRNERDLAVVLGTWLVPRFSCNTPAPRPHRHTHMERPQPLSLSGQLSSRRSLHAPRSLRSLAQCPFAAALSATGRATTPHTTHTPCLLLNPRRIGSIIPALSSLSLSIDAHRHTLEHHHTYTHALLCCPDDDVSV